MAAEQKQSCVVREKDAYVESVRVFKCENKKTQKGAVRNEEYQGLLVFQIRDLVHTGRPGFVTESIELLPSELLGGVLFTLDLFWHLDDEDPFKWFKVMKRTMKKSGLFKNSLGRVAQEIAAYLKSCFRVQSWMVNFHFVIVVDVRRLLVSEEYLEAARQKYGDGDDDHDDDDEDDDEDDSDDDDDDDDDDDMETEMEEGNAGRHLDHYHDDHDMVGDDDHDDNEDDVDMKMEEAKAGKEHLDDDHHDYSDDLMDDDNEEEEEDLVDYDEEDDDDYEVETNVMEDQIVKFMRGCWGLGERGREIKIEEVKVGGLTVEKMELWSLGGGKFTIPAATTDQNRGAEGEQDQNRGGEKQVMECSICLGEMAGEVGNNSRLKWLPENHSWETVRLRCGHWFHHQCIFEWLPRKPSCPICRSSSLTII